MFKLTYSLGALLCFTLTGCGGGGSGSTVAPSLPPIVNLPAAQPPGMTLSAQTDTAGMTQYYSLVDGQEIAFSKVLHQLYLTAQSSDATVVIKAMDGSAYTTLHIKPLTNAALSLLTVSDPALYPVGRFYFKATDCQLISSTGALLTEYYIVEWKGNNEANAEIIPINPANQISSVIGGEDANLPVGELLATIQIDKNYRVAAINASDQIFNLKPLLF